MFEEIVAAFERGEVIPYLGPGVLSLARSSELPASPEALVSYLTKTATVPHKIRNNLTAAAQYIENFKHRKTVVAAMNNAFSAPTGPSALHEWLAARPKLPLLVKGICHPDDARRAKDGGVDGIYCSNHGGRQANGGLPALDCLPGVVEAADGLPVLFDSGIRSGADVVKALALGATAVGVGRPYAFGLALGGVDGIVHVLRMMLAEADLIMAVDGYPALKDLTPETLRRVD